MRTGASSSRFVLVQFKHLGSSWGYLTLYFQCLKQLLGVKKTREHVLEVKWFHVYYISFVFLKLLTCVLNKDKLN